MAVAGAAEAHRWPAARSHGTTTATKASSPAIPPITFALPTTTLLAAGPRNIHTNTQTSTTTTMAARVTPFMARILAGGEAVSAGADVRFGLRRESRPSGDHAHLNRTITAATVSTRLTSASALINNT